MPLKKTLQFVGLVLVTIVFNYFTADIFSTAFLVGILFVYFRSEGNEAFWFAYFITLSDGFFGFFGAYEAGLSAIPGLPEVEVTQIYIILSVVKARMIKNAKSPFYQLHLQIFLVYILFLVAEGYAIGLSSALNVQFRVFKLIVPFLLFYSVPRLFKGEAQYRECFHYLFITAIVACCTQIFTVSLMVTPPMFFGVKSGTDYFATKIDDENPYRGFFNTGIVLISLFGAMFFAGKRNEKSNQLIFYVVIIANFLSAFLSATRGWTVCFFLAILFFFGFVAKVNFKYIPIIVAIAVASFMIMLSFPIFKTQINNSVERMLTLKSLEKGDLTAGGTLQRLSERGPRIMKKWAKSPLTGWGFSDDYFVYDDGHVGNQNTLMHAGIIGFVLLLSFFFYFCMKISLLSLRLPSGHPDKAALLMFGGFFVCWYFLHSTSGQQFGLATLPGVAMTQALFFSFGAEKYREITERINEANYPETTTEETTEEESPEMSLAGDENE